MRERVLCQQRFYFPPEFRIAATGGIQAGSAPGSWHAQNLGHDPLDLPAALVGHTASFTLSSRNNQSLASRQSRSTVSRETCSASAISSVANPPKNLISTTWDFRMSDAANVVSASSKAIRLA